MRMPVDDSCGKREDHGIHTPACLPFCLLEMMKVDDLFNEKSLYTYGLVSPFSLKNLLLI